MFLVIVNFTLSQVTFEKYLAGNATQANLASFFGMELANRATRKEVPHKYQELVNKWDTTFGAGAGPSFMEIEFLDKKVAESLMIVAPLAPISPSGKRKRTITAHNWCGMFNTPKGCPNSPNEGGCTDQGRCGSTGATFA